MQRCKKQEAILQVHETKVMKLQKLDQVHREIFDIAKKVAKWLGSSPSLSQNAGTSSHKADADSAESTTAPANFGSATGGSPGVPYTAVDILQEQDKARKAEVFRRIHAKAAQENKQVQVKELEERLILRKKQLSKGVAEFSEFQTLVQQQNQSHRKQGDAVTAAATGLPTDGARGHLEAESETEMNAPSSGGEGMTASADHVHKPLISAGLATPGSIVGAGHVIMLPFVEERALACKLSGWLDDECVKVERCQAMRVSIQEQIQNVELELNACEVELRRMLSLAYRAAIRLACDTNQNATIPAFRPADFVVAHDAPVFASLSQLHGMLDGFEALQIHSKFLHTARDILSPRSSSGNISTGGASLSGTVSGAAAGSTSTLTGRDTISSGNGSCDAPDAALAQGQHHAHAPGGHSNHASSGNSNYNAAASVPNLASPMPHVRESGQVHGVHQYNGNGRDTGGQHKHTLQPNHGYNHVHDATAARSVGPGQQGRSFEAGNGTTWGANALSVSGRDSDSTAGGAKLPLTSSKSAGVGVSGERALAGSTSLPSTAATPAHSSGNKRGAGRKAAELQSARQQRLDVKHLLHETNLPARSSASHSHNHGHGHAGTPHSSSSGAGTISSPSAHVTAQSQAHGHASGKHAPASQVHHHHHLSNTSSGGHSQAVASTLSSSAAGGPLDGSYSPDYYESSHGTTMSCDDSECQSHDNCSNGETASSSETEGEAPAQLVKPALRIISRDNGKLKVNIDWGGGWDDLSPPQPSLPSVLPGHGNTEAEAEDLHVAAAETGPGTGPGCGPGSGALLEISEFMIEAGFRDASKKSIFTVRNNTTSYLRCAEIAVTIPDEDGDLEVRVQAKNLWGLSAPSEMATMWVEGMRSRKRRVQEEKAAAEKRARELESARLVELQHVLEEIRAASVASSAPGMITAEQRDLLNAAMDALVKVHTESRVKPVAAAARAIKDSRKLINESRDAEESRVKVAAFEQRVQHTVSLTKFEANPARRAFAKPSTTPEEAEAVFADAEVAATAVCLEWQELISEAGAEKNPQKEAAERLRDAFFSVLKDATLQCEAPPRALAGVFDLAEMQPALFSGEAMSEVKALRSKYKKLREEWLKTKERLLLERKNELERRSLTNAEKKKKRKENAAAAAAAAASGQPSQGVLSTKGPELSSSISASVNPKNGSATQNAAAVSSMSSLGTAGSIGKVKGGHRNGAPAPLGAANLVAGEAFSKLAGNQELGTGGNGAGGGRSGNADRATNSSSSSVAAAVSSASKGMMSIIPGKGSKSVVPLEAGAGGISKQAGHNHGVGVKDFQVGLGTGDSSATMSLLSSSSQPNALSKASPSSPGGSHAAMISSQMALKKRIIGVEDILNGVDPNVDAAYLEHLSSEAGRVMQANDHDSLKRRELVDAVRAGETNTKKFYKNGSFTFETEDTEKRPLESLVVGGRYLGRVVGIAKFGLFVDIGCEKPGLVHISQIREGFISNVNDEVKMLEQVYVRIASLSVEKKNFSCTMRENAEIPGDMTGGTGEIPDEDPASKAAPVAATLIVSESPRVVNAWESNTLSFKQVLAAKESDSSVSGQSQSHVKAEVVGNTTSADARVPVGGSSATASTFGLDSARRSTPAPTEAEAWPSLPGTSAASSSTNQDAFSHQRPQSPVNRVFAFGSLDDDTLFGFKHDAVVETSLVGAPTPKPASASLFFGDDDDDEILRLSSVGESGTGVESHIRYHGHRTHSHPQASANLLAELNSSSLPAGAFSRGGVPRGAEVQSGIPYGAAGADIAWEQAGAAAAGTSSARNGSAHALGVSHNATSGSSVGMFDDAFTDSSTLAGSVFGHALGGHAPSLGGGNAFGPQQVSTRFDVFGVGTGGSASRAGPNSGVAGVSGASGGIPHFDAFGNAPPGSLSAGKAPQGVGQPAPPLQQASYVSMHAASSGAFQHQMSSVGPAGGVHAFGGPYHFGVGMGMGMGIPQAAMSPQMYHHPQQQPLPQHHQQQLMSHNHAPAQQYQQQQQPQQPQHHQTGYGGSAFSVFGAPGSYPLPASDVSGGSVPVSTASSVRFQSVGSLSYREQARTDPNDGFDDTILNSILN
ncbi:General stress protein 13 [Porphyridium purpureum]|uniref:General stress protein 13 n=1 Tax=Porphyridium purpureum TaxID=35688 RepID=A0A5J4Z6E8_PORPP|nr:General stress protein 13 [Porphyridium purpureum]|eukprot:POR4616..scf295_1